MIAADGKKRKIQAANVEGLLRIIQSIPSPKDTSVRQAGIGCSPARAVVGGKKDTTAISSGKEIRARDRKSPDISVRQAGIDCCPACAVVGGKKDTGISSPGQEIRSGYG